MCGRVTLALDQQTILEVLKDVYDIANEPVLPHTPDYNIAPGSQLLSVIGTPTEHRAGLLTWGVTPSWAKDKSSLLINARSETAATKATFRKSFQTKRCILLADHFYEWKKSTTKIPYLFSLEDQPVMPLAGLYTTSKEADGTKINSCVILTCQANSLMAPIHHRMPAILTPDTIDQWLHPSTDEKQLNQLLRPYDSTKMTAYKVSDYVNSAANNGPECIVPLP